jgi:hypothetical protein
LWITCVSEGLVVLTPSLGSVPGDVTGDGAVDVDDLIAVILAWDHAPHHRRPARPMFHQTVMLMWTT